MSYWFVFVCAWLLGGTVGWFCVRCSLLDSEQYNILVGSGIECDFWLGRTTLSIGK